MVESRPRREKLRAEESIPLLVIVVIRCLALIFHGLYTWYFLDSQLNDIDFLSFQFTEDVERGLHCLRANATLMLLMQLCSRKAIQVPSRFDWRPRRNPSTVTKVAGWLPVARPSALTNA
jgi:hypothetical protein